MTSPILSELCGWLARVAGLTRQRREHDYREQWMAFTRRMSRVHSVDEIARALVEDAGRTSRATAAAVYLVDGDAAAYRLSVSIGKAHFAGSIDHAAALPSWLRTVSSSVRLPVEFLPCITTPALRAARVVPVRWRTLLLGFMVLGPRPGGSAHTAEDGDMLATLAEQAAAAIVAARQVNVEAEPRRLETFDRFTATVVHDLKNSVSALSLLARNAAGNFSDPEFQRDAVTTLSRTVERMRRLLVKLSGPDAATPPVRTEPIDLHELIVEATTPLARDSRVRLVRRLRPVNIVYGDRDALLRVVENLTTNAAEAIDHEGTVTVTLAEEQGHAVISVADTGCGIPEEYQERHLFSPFRSTKKGGWGIGLYQTKQVVENQDGEILVESVEGHGTTFTVRLPLRSDVESHSLESVR